MKVIEDTGTGLLQEIDSDVIEFELSDESVNFDDIVGQTEQPPDESESEMDAMTATGDDRTTNELEAGVGLDSLTYYPDIRRSERRTAGIPPKKLGYKLANMVSEAEAQTTVTGRQKCVF